jgi:glycosyltransferase involved in cell wall biosynthesis
LKIAFLVNKVFAGWKPTDIRLGGTEESVVRWSEEFVASGHEVTVFQNGYYGYYHEVWYADRDEYSGGFDVTINVKSPEVAPIGPTWYLTNETDASKLDLSAYDGVIWPSQWAKDRIRVNNANVQVVPHGYDETTIYPATKMPKQVLYASSPDRGLYTLLEVWPEVVEAHPDAMLIVTYGAKPRDVPNTIFMGEVSEVEMNDLYKTSDIWCHPCNGGELFGITAIKAQAAGCVPVYFPTMALAETVQSGIKSNPALLADDLTRVLGDETLKESIRQDLTTKTFVNWKDSANRLLEVITPVLT